MLYSTIFQVYYFHFKIYNKSELNLKFYRKKSNVKQNFAPLNICERSYVVSLCSYVVITTYIQSNTQSELFSAEFKHIRCREVNRGRFTHACTKL